MRKTAPLALLACFAIFGLAACGNDQNGQNGHKEKTLTLKISHPDHTKPHCAMCDKRYRKVVTKALTEIGHCHVSEEDFKARLHEVKVHYHANETTDETIIKGLESKGFEVIRI